MRCFCCSSNSFKNCCEPFLSGSVTPAFAEQLMRSRFTAYSLNKFDYVLNTYTEEKRNNLSVNELADSATGATWFALVINKSSQLQVESERLTLTQDTVEFTAYYFENKHVYQLHETSNFVKEDGLWRYHDGLLHDDCGKVKLGRNLPCPCGSNRKFKQCCASKAR